jgi:catalase-peroxidase
MLKSKLLLAALLTLASANARAGDADSAAPKPYPKEDPGRRQRMSNQFWWPERLDLSPLREHDAEANPFGAKFDYAKEFKKLDLDVVKKDIASVMKTPQAWWPADYGNYGPFFIRMAWHGAGTYRVGDGRGGASGAQ